MNHDLVDSVGLTALTSRQKDQLLAGLYHRLEDRVGLRLAADLSAEQLDDFELLFESGDEAAALAWVEKCCPHYRSVVEEETAEALAVLRENAAVILRSAAVGA